MPQIETTPDAVRRVYETARRHLAVVRRRLNRPLTLAEKVLYGHLAQPEQERLDPGQAYVALRPDRVAMQDATAQMALLQFMTAGLDDTAVPTTVHCDHLIRAHSGAAADVEHAVVENREVYEFLESGAARYGMGFWRPGSGIIHQVVLENYAFPGGLMIGTDSHTPNAGGLGMIACGVGGADAVDVMAGFPWEVLHPRLIGVRLTGALRGWTAPKDVILKLCEILTVQGATNHIVEYFGPGTASISCTGKATITNMGAEIGATTSLFPFDDRMATYLEATARGALAALAREHRELLAADPETATRPEDHYHQVVEIDLDRLEPRLVGPHTPDLAWRLPDLAAAAGQRGYPLEISAALIGSCTNSSYEDLTRAAAAAAQALARGATLKAPLLITPGSEQIHATIERDGQLAVLRKLGAQVLANACGPCIGQWQRERAGPNTIVTTFNRNFPRRNDGNPHTHAFIGSPEVVLAYALSGRLDRDPLAAELAGTNGPFVLEAPGPAPEVPPHGFVFRAEGYRAPPADRGRLAVKIDPRSERLARLEPFAAWNGADFVDLPVLLKAVGKCTTDHISMAGPWLRFRGHLDHISDNLFLGATNAATAEPGTGVNVFTGETGPLAAIARAYQALGQPWIVVGDENYGEGSSREHAAMEPRHLGGVAIVARSFARIHETNLKKQGVLALTFSDPADYDRVRSDDRVTLRVKAIAPGRPVTAVLQHTDGATEEIALRHTLSAEQIEWLRAGSALNRLRRS
ncbi:MAG: aconitate hydratase [Planctomycetes bacterium]|nr:aconitate hydratase [Planctomycetota bacterium]